MFGNSTLSMSSDWSPSLLRKTRGVGRTWRSYRRGEGGSKKGVSRRAQPPLSQQRGDVLEHRHFTDTSELSREATRRAERSGAPHVAAVAPAISPTAARRQAAVHRKRLGEPLRWPEPGKRDSPSPDKTNRIPLRMRTWTPPEGRVMPGSPSAFGIVPRPPCVCRAE